MSYIFETLKKGEQKARWGRGPKPFTVEPTVATPAWEVKMVSHARFARFRLKAEERNKGRRIAMLLLALLLLPVCVIAYGVRGRMSEVTTEVSRLATQISETEIQMTKLKEEQLRLNMENDSLRQESELARAELARAREVIEANKVRQQHMIARKSQPAVTDRKGLAKVPLAVVPPRPMTGPPLEADPPGKLDLFETASAKVYSIR